MRRLWSLAKPHAWRFGWGSFMLLCTNLATMAIPQLFAHAVDAIVGNAQGAVLKSLAFTLVLVAAGGAVFRTLSRVHVFYAARDVELDLRCAFYRHLSTL